MTDEQWDKLLAVVRGEIVRPLPTGFILDSSWLPNWAGHQILDYFTNDSVWMGAHGKALAAFPSTWFLPGFGADYGMCTEPSAFGAVTSWSDNEFPIARRVLRSPEEVDRIERPNPRQDGLLPFVLKRLQRARPEIERGGHKIRFAVARGPLSIASFLMGTTEFLSALRTHPAEMHRLLAVVTDFLVEWVAVQRERFVTIDGLLVLDDMVGFVGRVDFQTFAAPYLARLFAADVAVKFFHNDAPCKVAAPFLPDLGINMLSFGIQHTLADMKAWTQGKIVLLGNIPARDVLVQATAAKVEATVREQLESLPDRSRLIMSCAGAMPRGAPTENIRTLIEAARAFTR